MKNFKDLKVWQKGFKIAVICYKYISGFSKEEKYTVVSQITRAGVSIPSNIKEGSRSSKKEYGRFFRNCIGFFF